MDSVLQQGREEILHAREDLGHHGEVGTEVEPKPVKLCFISSTDNAAVLL